jgi:N-acetylmuramoyl-L-alanine amidase
MARTPSTRDLRLLAMLMQAEARGEERTGMHMVGTVVRNRLIANCAPDFKGLRSYPQVVLQPIKGRPGLYHFEPVQNGELYKMRPSSKDLRLARDVARGRINPRVREALWFLNPSPGRRYRIPCPPQMPGSPMTRYLTSYRNHCFYVGVSGYCKEFYYR